jgi:hypothetical protein
MPLTPTLGVVTNEPIKTNSLGSTSWRVEKANWGYRSSIAGSCKNNSKIENKRIRKLWRHKNKNRIN